MLALMIVVFAHVETKTIAMTIGEKINLWMRFKEKSGIIAKKKRMQIK